MLFNINVPVTLKSVTVMAETAVEETVNVPVKSRSETVIVSATRFVMSNVAELVTLIVPNVAVLAVKALKLPFALLMDVLVIPASSSCVCPLDAKPLNVAWRLVMSDIACECDADAYADKAVERSVTSATLCVCP